MISPESLQHAVRSTLEDNLGVQIGALQSSNVDMNLIVSRDGFRGYYTQDAEQLLDIQACFVDPTYNNRLQPQVPYSIQPYTWNGLLRCTTARFRTTVEDTADPSDPADGLLEVLASNTPSAINQAQSALGHTPGEDVLQIVRVPDHGKFTDGEWLEGLAMLRVRAADPMTSMRMAMHDTDLEDHVQSWLALPPRHTLALGRRAQRLQKKYGDSVHGSLDYDHPVTRFVSEVDYLGRVTSRILSPLYDFGIHTNVRRTPKNVLARLEKTISYTDTTIHDPSIVNKHRRRDIKTLHEIGVIGRFGQKQELRKVASEIVAYAASQLITAHEIGSELAFETPFSTPAERVDFYRQVQLQFSA